MIEDQHAVWEIPQPLRNAEIIAESVRHPLLVLDKSHHVVVANPAFYRMFRVSPDETVGFLLFDVGNRQWDIPELRRLLDEVLAEQQAFDDFRVEHDFETIGPRIMLINGRRLDHLSMVLLAIEDVTDKERARAEIRLAELNHRLKNAMQAVQALMELSMQRSNSLEQFRASFEGRLQALARVQEILTTAEQSGASLRAVFEGEIDPYCGREGPECVIEGEEVRLNARAASSLQMVLHELTTNAVKHGALSTPGGRPGRIHIRWHIRGQHEPIPPAPEGEPPPSRGGEEPRLELTWTESGGPFGGPPEIPGKATGEGPADGSGESSQPGAATGPAGAGAAGGTDARVEGSARETPGGTAPYARAPGFGLTLIHSIIRYELEGEFEQAFSDAGFSCTIALPWTDRIRFHDAPATEGLVVSEDVKYDRAGQPLPPGHLEQERESDA